MLPRQEIIRRLKSGDLTVIGADNKPISESQVGECSLDLRLSGNFRRIRPRCRFKFFPIQFDLACVKEDTITEWFREVKVAKAGSLVLRPNETVLATSEETVRLPADLCGIVTGRSSFARLGISVETSQNLIVPGHATTIPLQIRNNSPFSLRIYPGIRVAQLALVKLEEATELVYSRKPYAKHLEERTAQASRFYEDPEVATLPCKWWGQIEPDWSAILDASLLGSVVLAILIQAPTMYSTFLGKISLAFLIAALGARGVRFYREVLRR